jgi:DNA-binding transcriptional LysR family regulator
LSSHHLIGNSRASSMNLWEMQDAKSGLQVKGQTLTDSSAVLLSMVGSGVGIARLLDIVAAPFVKTGRLPKIRACVEFWGAYLGAVSAAH